MRFDLTSLSRCLFIQELVFMNGIFCYFHFWLILSFTLSVILLLIVAAKRGLLRVGASSKPAKFNPLLLPNTTLTPKIVEMTPLKDPAY
ncbi:hypothetical protein B5X24_HaOG210093 [Helicoverpa armigera]|nr:hypothetical protein B5X24_HaOG210093 [Helicoverpa armigera]